MKQQPEGVAGSPPDPKPLRSVSPSQLGLMRMCALSVLWSAQRAPRALPRGPASRLGTVAHRLLGEVGAGLLTNPSREAIEARWEQLVRDADGLMTKSWLERHLVPLRHSVTHYEVRRIQSIRLAQAIAQPAPRAPETMQPGRLGGHEVPVATSNGKVVGRIDHLMTGPMGTVVRDYKSGAIYRERLTGQLTLKAEYSTQLKLYAALVAAMTGEWPARLEIVSLDGTNENVPFEEDDCIALLREAEDLLDASNEIVNSSEPTRNRIQCLARPSAAACRFCSYRPICPAYLKCGGGDKSIWPRDVFGVVSDVRRLGNGRVAIELRMDDVDTSCRIVGLNPSMTRHPALDYIGAGTLVGVFNLGRLQGPSSFAEGPLTTIYSFETGF